VAKELGATPAALAIAWCLRNPHVSSVILGATRQEQLLQNLGALELVDRFEPSAWDRVEASVA
jgi:aryl-alcohol dehydrogenase-like predicted oxidoreductase